MYIYIYQIKTHYEYLKSIISETLGWLKGRNTDVDLG